MSGFTGAGILPTTVTTAAQGPQAPLGFELTVPNGNNGFQTWVYVEAGAALEEGIAVMRTDATTEYKCVVATALVPNIRIMGVAQHTIASGSFGFVLKRGLGEVQAGDTGNDQANSPLVVHNASGQADVMAATNEEDAVFAFSTESVAAAGNKMTCWINCAG